MSEHWVIILKNPSASQMYLGDDMGWWADTTHATMLSSKEEAEKLAFSAVSQQPSLIGCVAVEKLSQQGDP